MMNVPDTCIANKHHLEQVIYAQETQAEADPEMGPNEAHTQKR